MKRLQFGIRHLLGLAAAIAVALQGYQLFTGASLDDRMVTAARRGDITWFRLMLWLGADVDCGAGASGYGPTPLLDAAWRGDLPAVRLFVEHGAYIDYEEKDGFSAITYAAGHSHWDVVEYLYHSGANFRLPDGSGLTAIDYALQQGRSEMVAMFHSRLTPEGHWRISSKHTALHEVQDEPSNFRYDVWHRWPKTGREACVKTLHALVTQSTDGTKVINGPVHLDFSDDGNSLHVTFADGAQKRFEL